MREADQSLRPKAMRGFSSVGALTASDRSRPPPPRCVGEKGEGGDWALAMPAEASIWAAIGAERPRPTIVRTKRRRLRRPALTSRISSRSAWSSMVLPSFLARSQPGRLSFWPWPVRPDWAPILEWILRPRHPGSSVLSINHGRRHPVHEQVVAFLRAELVDELECNREIQPHDLVSWINPELDASCTMMVEGLWGMQRSISQPLFISMNTPAKSPRGFREELTGDLRTDTRDLISRHLGHRCWAENSHIPVAPTIEEHLTEYRHVHHGRIDTPGGPRQLLMFSRAEARSDYSNGERRIQWALDDPGADGIRHNVECVLHPQRLKDPFSRKVCQRLSTDSPHDFPQ